MELKALILCGGKSSRMGIDKSTLLINGIPFFEKIARELDYLGLPVVLSCRVDQKEVVNSGRNYLLDNSKAEGPMKGMHSANLCHPEQAWLVLTVDMVKVDFRLLSLLIQNRKPNAKATVFDISKPNEKSFPIPFPGIYEPTFFTDMKKSIDNGQFSIRQMILQSDAKIISCPYPETLKNINTPEDLECLLEKKS
ncbi:MAG: molybdenum cofactor guanylyltransferase [Saprospirales bacterium]|nr:MAG: molybdenum cofactor guanylyltransferase [Saprospirales bacterium]